MWKTRYFHVAVRLHISILKSTSRNLRKFQTWNLMHEFDKSQRFTYGVDKVNHNKPFTLQSLCYQVSHVSLHVLTAPNTENTGCRGQVGGHSSARILPAKPVTPASTHSFHLSPPPEKEHPPIFHAWLQVAVALFLWVAIWGQFPAYRALNAKPEDICTVWLRRVLSSDTQSQTCITREALEVSLTGQFRKKKKQRSRINKNSTEKRGNGRGR